MKKYFTIILLSLVISANAQKPWNSYPYAIPYPSDTLLWGSYLRNTNIQERHDTFISEVLSNVVVTAGTNVVVVTNANGSFTISSTGGGGGGGTTYTFANTNLNAGVLITNGSTVWIGTNIPASSEHTFANTNLNAGVLVTNGNTVWIGTNITSTGNTNIYFVNGTNINYVNVGNNTNRFDFSAPGAINGSSQTNVTLINPTIPGVPTSSNFLFAGQSGVYLYSHFYEIFNNNNANYPTNTWNLYLSISGDGRSFKSSSHPVFIDPQGRTGRDWTYAIIPANLSIQGIDMAVFAYTIDGFLTNRAPNATIGLCYTTNFVNFIGLPDMVVTNSTYTNVAQAWSPALYLDGTNLFLNFALITNYTGGNALGMNCVQEVFTDFTFTNYYQTNVTFQSGILTASKNDFREFKVGTNYYMLLNNNGGYSGDLELWKCTTNRNGTFTRVWYNYNMSGEGPTASLDKNGNWRIYQSYTPYTATQQVTAYYLGDANIEDTNWIWTPLDGSAAMNNGMCTLVTNTYVVHELEEVMEGAGNESLVSPTITGTAGQCYPQVGDFAQISFFNQSETVFNARLRYMYGTGYSFGYGAGEYFTPAFDITTNQYGTYILTHGDGVNFGNVRIGAQNTTYPGMDYYLPGNELNIYGSLSTHLQSLGGVDWAVFSSSGESLAAGVYSGNGAGLTNVSLATNVLNTTNLVGVITITGSYVQNASDMQFYGTNNWPVYWINNAKTNNPLITLNPTNFLVEKFIWTSTNGVTFVNSNGNFLVAVGNGSIYTNQVLVVSNYANESVIFTSLNRTNLFAEFIHSKQYWLDQTAANVGGTNGAFGSVLTLGGNGVLTTSSNLNGANVVGTLPLSTMPSAVVTNKQTSAITLTNLGNIFSGYFTNGNGSGLTNLNGYSLTSSNATVTVAYSQNPNGTTNADLSVSSSGSIPNNLVTNNASATIVVTNAGVATTITSNSITTGGITNTGTYYGNGFGLTNLPERMTYSSTAQNSAINQTGSGLTFCFINGTQPTTSINYQYFYSVSIAMPTNYTMTRVYVKVIPNANILATTNIIFSIVTNSVLMTNLTVQGPMTSAVGVITNFTINQYFNNPTNLIGLSVSNSTGAAMSSAIWSFTTFGTP